MEGSLAGKRVVISTDGGRLRVRQNQRGQKTKKGRSRYRTDLREPKLLVIYVVDAKGQLAQEFTPVMDGTLQGPDEVFRLIEFYLGPLHIDQAQEVLFIADGAKKARATLRAHKKGRAKDTRPWSQIHKMVIVIAHIYTVWLRLTAMKGAVETTARGHWDPGPRVRRKQALSALDGRE